MSKKLLLPLLLLCFFGQVAFAQNVNYQVEVRYLGWDGRSDQNGTPEYAYLVTPYDNLTTGSQTCFYYGDDLPGTDANGAVTSIPNGNFNVINQSSRIRTVSNTAATTIGINLTAYEKDCSNNCTFDPGCNCVFLLGCLSEDDDLATCNGLSAVSFRNQPPCQWNDYGIVRCGSYTIAIRIRWEYTSISAGSISTTPVYSFCGLGDPPLIANATPASNFTSYQWQYRDGCTGSWTDIPGATADSYDPPFGLTTTRCYQRVATVCQIAGGSISASSNSYTATLTSGISGNAVSSSANFCATSAPPQTLTGGPVTDGVHSDYIYDWQVSTDGVNFSTVQSSSSILNYTTPTLVTTTYYRRKTCPGENPGTGNVCIGTCDNYSNVLTIGVTAPITNNTITGNQTVCGISDPAILTGSLPAGGNGLFTYQWQQSASVGGPYTNIFGANSQSYDPPSLSATTYFQRVVTSGVCTSVAGPITVTVIPDITNNVVTGGQSYCGSGDAPAFTVTLPSGGAGLFTYLWEQSTTGVGGWSPASGVSNASIYNPPLLSSTMYYRRTVFSGSVPCSLVSNPVAIIITAPITNNNINGNQINCDTLQAPLLQTGASPGGGNGIFSYFWQQSTDLGATWANITGSLTQNYQPGVIGQTTVFRRVVSSSVCTDTSNRDTITIVPAIKNNTIDGYQRFCGSGNPANIVGATATGGTGTLTYSWESSPDGTNWTPIPSTNTVSYDPPAVHTFTTYYRRIVTSSVCSSVSNVSTVAILKLPVVSQLIKTDLTCFKSDNGTINVAGNSFNGGISYSIDSTASYHTSGAFTGLAAGTYNVFVSDDSSCVNNYNNNPVVITQPDSLYLSFTKADASCSNVFNGQINVTPTGGTPQYSYSLNNGSVQSSNVFSSLGSGTYFITLYDKNGCTDTATAIINNSYSVTASIDSQRNVSCFGANDGQVAVKLTGGTAPLSYSINGIVYQSNPIFSGLSAGTYLVSMKDSKGCTDVVSVVITQPAALSITIDSIKNNLCSGGTGGSIYTSVVGGTAPYTYTWSNSASTDDITGLVAGTYSLTVNDSRGCSAVSSSTISQPVALFVTLAQSADVLCKGDSSGSVDITVSGGVPNYSFVWNTGDTLEDLAKLVGGTYAVTVTDLNGCQKTFSHTVSEPAQVLTVVLSKTDATCNGAADGTATATVTGGTSPYTYLWSNNSTTSSISGLSAGAYFVTVKDANGCSVVQSISISQPLPFVVSGTVTDVNCKGQSTGSINVSVTPAGVYTFTWSSPSATGQNPTGLAAGAYTVTVNLTSNPGCTVSKTFTIAEPASVLGVNLAGFDSVKCAGSNNGFIDITATGGTPSYIYSWTKDGSAYATTEDLLSLSAGTYAVTITDSKGCTATLTQAITQPAQVLTVVLSKTDATCNGAADGTATATVTGGTSPYTYLWSNNSTTNSISGLSAGAYFVTVKDANGCSVVQSISIGQPLPFVVSGTVTDVNCKGQSTGSINVSVTPAGVYTFTWSSPSAIGQNPTGLAAGAYTVTVNLTSNPGCTVSKTFTIAEPASVLGVNLAGFDSVKCAGSNNGFIDITATGGTPSYTYSWTKDGSAYATTEDLASLSTGTYAVTVADSKGCTATLSQVISNPVPIVSSIVKTDLKCFGDHSGTATLTVSGGEAPYTYLWSNFNGSKNLSQLDGGLYTVVITDANGCEKRDSINIVEPTPLVLSTQVTNISCHNANDGAIDLTVTGGTPLSGTPKYTYTWAHGPVTEDITGLSQANYAVTVKDANLCSAATSVLIVNPPSINSVVVITNPLCNVANGNNTGGAISVGVSGGTPGYTYAWSPNANGSTTSTVNNVTGGVYYVTITDSRSCTKVDSAVLIEPDPIVYNVFIRNVSCKDNRDGFLDITAYGGTAPYSFLWSNGNLTEDVGNIPGGNYTVSITDKNNCTAQGFFQVKEPDSLKVTITKTDATCQGANTGSVHAVVTGGTLQYNYLWNNFSFDSLQNNIPGGTYSVVVTDSNKCQVSASVVVNGQPSPMALTKSASNPKCVGADNGFVSVVVSGGAQPYTYNWNTATPQTGNMATSLPAGTYVVTVTDKVGCSATETTQLVDPLPIVVSTSGSSQVSCANSNDGIVIVNVGGGKSPFIYQFDGFAQASDTFRNIGPGTYSVLVRDANGCESTSVATIASASQLAVDLTSDKEVILVSQPVQLTATATSDTTIKNYIWTPISASFDFSGCADSTNCNNPIARPHQTTTFVVTVVDARGCTATDTLNVEVSNDNSYFFPTAFTPNGDGLNDFFEFDVLGAVSFDVNVWNRWGEKVFSNPNQKNGITQSATNGAWDGMFRGKKAQFDTYTYQIVVKYFDGTTENKAGTITVMQ